MVAALALDDLGARTESLFAPRTTERGFERILRKLPDPTALGVGLLESVHGSSASSTTGPLTVQG
jgi:hypothetical protein